MGDHALDARTQNFDRNFGAVRQICKLYLTLEGMDDRFRIVWDDISLQDITQEAQADLYRAQAEKYRAEAMNQ